MKKRKIFLGNNEVHTAKAFVNGQFVNLDGEKYYMIQNYHEMPDFFISIVSNSDHWMFISSNGSLSAGRKDSNNALFPYYTDDKIHDYKGITGSASFFLVEKDNRNYLWEPFTDDSKNAYRITRNLYKSIYGNKIIFEEVNTDLELSFRYGWYNSDQFGFVKKSRLISHSKSRLKIELLDGMRNILPYGVDSAFQNEYSNLLDAYKKNERIEKTSLGLFMLSSIPIDKSEPSEALKVNTVWSAGPTTANKILISDKQLTQFKMGLSIESEVDIRASRGAYFINAQLELTENAVHEWLFVAELSQGSTDVANLNRFIAKTSHIKDLIDADIEAGTNALKKMVAYADGFQLTNTDLCYARHFSNTLYNIMRGGVFANNYNIPANDFRAYLWQINRLVCKKHQTWLEQIPNEIAYLNLLEQAEETGDADLIRITSEYLPLTFSRRHGDPSRPWNKFSIETKNEDGELKYYYAGNWRDIFQNWEALCFSYPEFVEGIISKFVNASTIDGYNPYRIMRDGIDWESPDPHDTWAYIGYWGDHQIAYLQKLLELSHDFHPRKLERLLSAEIFTYANVPYRIKAYTDILRNPKDTVVFNTELNNRINSEAEHLGADARLLKNRMGKQIYKVNLTEKLLVSLLSKLSNFIPEAGIWMNTQRPEWNDANNALVGNGASMVTLYYLRRFLKFIEDSFQSIGSEKTSVSEEVFTLFESLSGFFSENLGLLEKGFSDRDRKYFADFLGGAHEKYREEIYNYSFSGEKKEVSFMDLAAFTNVCLKYVDHSILANKREDGLYHAYNLISLNDQDISLRHLYEMLEGQVAVLSSGFLSSSESLEVLNALKSSKMFRSDQYSYMLYPNRQLPRFTEKNTISNKLIATSPLLRKLLEDKETSIIEQDEAGNCHFNGNFRNADVLESALNGLRIGSYSHLIEDEKDSVLAIYENIFDHQSFTGRSGTFYGYEGLGSIYWHMVSKLLLVTQECYFKARDEGADNQLVGQFKAHYYEIKAGIGIYKSPELYGAFPTDAYSHTPSDSGVKQPGLTGQVKEDVISRFGELGVRINQGKIVFESGLLNHNEILEKDQVFEYYSLSGESLQIQLTEGQLALSFCQLPVVYSFSDEQKIEVHFKDGHVKHITGNSIDPALSSLVFARSGELDLIKVSLKKSE